MNAIPTIVHPLGEYWRQPDSSEITIDDTYALMSEKTFQALAEYSTSVPSGVYEGKMWKKISGALRFLMWYGISDKTDCCSINSRKIIIV